MKALTEAEYGRMRAVIDAAVRAVTQPAWAGVCDEDVALEDALREGGWLPKPNACKPPSAWQTIAAMIRAAPTPLWRDMQDLLAAVKARADQLARDPDLIGHADLAERIDDAIRALDGCRVATAEDRAESAEGDRANQMYLELKSKE